MKHRLIHKNLDTSFVYLSGLVKYLQRRQFVGVIKVQLNGYRADIKLNQNKTLSVHEHDEISGRVSKGKEAFQRMLIRAREAGGSINVFQILSETGTAIKKPSAGNVGIPKPASPPITGDAQKPTNRITGRNVKRISARNGSNGKIALPDRPRVPEIIQRPRNGSRPPSPPPKPETGTSALPGFPFQLSNRVEAKAQQQSLSTTEEWQMLLKLTVELITVIDRSLATANLNFNSEFKKICLELAADYPFLSPVSETFQYANGRILVHKQVNSQIFISGIAESLRRLLVKLSRSQKYADVYKKTSSRLQKLMEKRSTDYDRLFIASQIRRIISP